MPFSLEGRVKNYGDPYLSKMYSAIEDLVNTAGHIRIEQLFDAPLNQFSPEEINTIKNARRVGIFFRGGNGYCWNESKNRCARSPDPFSYCQVTREGDPVLMADVCQ